MGLFALDPVQTILQNSPVRFQIMGPFVMAQCIPYNFCFGMFYDPDRRVFLARFQSFAHGKYFDFGIGILFPAIELIDDPEGFRYALHDRVIRFYHGDLEFLQFFVRSRSAANELLLYSGQSSQLYQVLGW